MFDSETLGGIAIVCALGCSMLAGVLIGRSAVSTSPEPPTRLEEPDTPHVTIGWFVAYPLDDGAVLLRRHGESTMAVLTSNQVPADWKAYMDQELSDED